MQCNHSASTMPNLIIEHAYLLAQFCLSSPAFAIYLFRIQKDELMGLSIKIFKGLQCLYGCFAGEKVLHFVNTGLLLFFVVLDRPFI